MDRQRPESHASGRHPLLLLLLVLLVARTPCPALAESLTERTDRIFATYAKPDSPGCAVLVLHRGSVVHRRGYGQAHLEWDAPISASTVFPAASLSKQFTAMSVCLLAEQGKLSLDDNVRKYLPELPDYGAVITLRHLLQHTSGIRDVWYLRGLAGWRPSDLVTNRDILNLAIRQKNLNFQPGERHVYNNTGYTLAGLVVERVSGQSLRAYTREQVLAPLGMNSTHLQDDHTEVVRSRASAYATRAGRFGTAVPNYEAQGTTGLFTTLEDMARWDQNFYDRRIGQKSALEQMLTPGKLTSGENVRYGDGLSYGMGLVIGRYRGLKIVGHSGQDWGYRSEFLQFPEQQLSVVILSNLSTVEPYSLAREVADIFLAKDFPQGAEPVATSKAQPVELSLPEVAAWAGTYWNFDTGASWTFSVNRGKLCISGKRELTPLGHDRFRLDPTPIQLVFTAGTRSAPRKLTWLDVEPEAFEAVPQYALRPSQLEAYHGTFRSEELNASLTVLSRKGELAVVGWRDDYGPLIPVVEDAFALRAGSLGSCFIHFVRNEQQEVSGFTVSTTGSKNIRFAKTP